MLSNLKVGTKLIAVLAAPLAVMLVLAGLSIRERLAEASDAQQVEDLAASAVRTTELVQSLQLERTASARLAGGATPELTEALTTQRAATDAASTRFSQESQALGGAARQAAVAATNELSNLAGLRGEVDEGTISTATLDGFGTLIDSILTVNRRIAEEPDLADASVSLISQLQIAETKELAADEAARLAFAYTNGSLGDAQFSQLSTIESERRSYYQLLQSPPDQEVRQILSEEMDAAGNFTQFPTLVATILVAGPGAPLPDVSAEASVLGAAESHLTALQRAENRVVLSVLSSANDAQESAQRSAILFALACIAAVFLSIVGALVVARAITRPLRRLTVAARGLSTEQLPALVERLRSPDISEEGIPEPEPITVSGNDEIGQLAAAFNSVQDVTYSVAQEQSQMLQKGISDIFVNLARRNQALLDRQIEFIDDLEAREEDPELLESLFKLDHLATRMRRNAESLLVLAGAEPNRRRSTPVPLADVVRVAVGEVEAYNRISLVAFDDADVPSNAAVDVAHLLSELMENATQFSPPETQVEIVGHRTSEGYTLSVSDQGIGMTADQLDEVNELLNSPPATGLSLARSLGFVVIARLAKRFDLKVRLTPSPSGGITALVTLPGALLTDRDGSEPEVADTPAAATGGVVLPPASRETPAAPAPLPTPAPPVITPRRTPVSSEPSIDLSEPVRLPAPGELPGRGPAPGSEPPAEELPAAAAMTPLAPPPSAPTPMPSPPRAPAPPITPPPAVAPLPITPPPAITPTPAVAPPPVVAPLPRSLDVPDALPTRGASPAAPPAVDRPTAPPIPEISLPPLISSGGITVPPPPVRDLPGPATGGETTPGGLPLWKPEFVAPEPATTDGLTTPAGLSRRQRPTTPLEAPRTQPFGSSERRSPDEVRQMLSRYRGGLKRGRVNPPSADNGPDRTDSEELKR